MGLGSVKLNQKNVFYVLLFIGIIYIVLVIAFMTRNKNSEESNLRLARPTSYQRTFSGNASELHLHIPVLPLKVLLQSSFRKVPQRTERDGQPYMRIPPDGFVSIPGCSSKIPRPFDLGNEPPPEWQTVEGHLSYAFSAFADYYSTDNFVLRILGMRQVNPLPLSMSCLCRLWYGRAELPEVVAGTIQVIHEGQWPDEYRAVVFECPLATQDAPYAVSLVSNKCSESKNLLYVKVRKPAPLPSKPSMEFTCCLPPLHSGINDVLTVVEWVETNMLLGAERFVFYNHSIGPDLSVVIRQYESEGKVMIIPWSRLPVRVSPFLRNLSDAQIMYFAQSVAINDCLYRSLGHTRYTVFIDLDEYIFPRKHRKWAQMINHLSEQSRSSAIGMFWFQNSFMEKHLPPDPKVLSSLHFARNFRDLRSKKDLLPYLSTMLFTKRRNFLWSFNFRSKMIVIPEGIEQLGIHFVHKFRPGFSGVKVPSDVAILQHYRFMKNVTDNFVVDLTAHSYKDDIVDRVWQRLAFLTGNF